MDFKKAVMVALAKKGMDKADLADKCQISRQSMYNWLAGKTSPSLAVVVTIATALGMKASELIALGEE